jgi:hypothetical protein
VRAHVPALVLLAVLTASACTTRTSTCVDEVCTISLSGEQTVEVEIGSLERDLRVSGITTDAVTVSARGEAADLGIGESARVGGLLVRVDSISGSDVGLNVQRG